MEVMVSVFVFSTSMLGFMAFHAHSMAVLFENESAQLAHALAFNLVDEINAMTYDSFSQLTSKTSADDIEIAGIMGGNDTNFKPGPFDSFGRASEDPDYNTSYTFHRWIEVTTYGNATQAYVQTGTYLSTLYNVDVHVAWNKREYPGEGCGKSSYSVAKCNSITIPLVRSDEQY